MFNNFERSVGRITNRKRLFSLSETGSACLLNTIQNFLQPSSAIYFKFLAVTAMLEELYPTILVNKQTKRRQNLTHCNLHLPNNSSFFNLKEHVINNRHETEELQTLYDINFGLVAT